MILASEIKYHITKTNKDHYSLCPVVSGDEYPRCIHLKDKIYCTAKLGERCNKIYN